MDAVAELARRRSNGWQVFGRIFQAPTREWVNELRVGEVRKRLEQAVGWRTGELDSFGPAMLVLGAYERAGRRRSAAHDAETLAAAFVAMARGQQEKFEDAEAACELLRQLCLDESAAWTGKLARARSLRSYQHEQLQHVAGVALDRGCAAILDAGARQPYAALALLCQLWVNLERAGSSFIAGP